MRECKILEDISENFTLVQLMYSLVNVNHAISVVGKWIFDSNYEKSLVLNRASLDMICAPYVGEEQASIFYQYLLQSDTFTLRRNLKNDSCYVSVKTKS